MAYRFDAEDIVGSMESAMDAAFARVGGPFRTFEDSLVAFARANYALRLGNGRCTASDPAACGGLYYDPDNAYVIPPLEANLYYSGSPLIHAGAIPASYGMEFVEVSLYPTVNDQPLVVTLEGQGTAAQFDVQIWKLGSRGAKPSGITVTPETVPQSDGAAHVYVIPHVDTKTYNRLALIITRIDADEGLDPAGAYTIVLQGG